MLLKCDDSNIWIINTLICTPPPHPPTTARPKTLQHFHRRLQAEPHYTKTWVSSLPLFPGNPGNCNSIVWERNKRWLRVPNGTAQHCWNPIPSIPCEVPHQLTGIGLRLDKAQSDMAKGGGRVKQNSHQQLSIQHMDGLKKTASVLCPLIMQCYWVGVVLAFRISSYSHHPLPKRWGRRKLKFKHLVTNFSCCILPPGTL